jgi:AcrR family transcriptional regulator
VSPLPQHLAKAPVGRTRISREALSELQRERIITAATEVFAKRGYQASTVDNIAAAAKIGVGSFYAQFDGKEDCLLASYEQIVAKAHTRFSAAVRADAPWSQQALTLLHELLALIAAEPMSARVALVEVQTGGPVALARYGETLDCAIAALADGRAVLDAEPARPATLEDATASGLAWLLAQRVMRGEAKNIEELFPQVAEIVLEPYLGPVRTKRELAAFERGAGR